MWSTSLVGDLGGLHDALLGTTESPRPDQTSNKKVLARSAALSGSTRDDIDADAAAHALEVMLSRASAALSDSA